MTYHLAIFALDTALVDTLGIAAGVRSEISGWRESFHPPTCTGFPTAVLTTPCGLSRLHRWAGID